MNNIVKARLDRTLHTNLRDFKLGYFEAGNINFIGNTEEIENSLQEYCVDNDVHLLTIDVATVKLSDVYAKFEELKESDKPIILYLKNYKATNPRTRYKFASIYKDNLLIEGVFATGKLKVCVTTIIISDPSITNYIELDGSEASCFAHVTINEQ